MGNLDLAGLLREHTSMHAVPGAAIGVIRDAAVTAAHSGVADATTGEPVTADTRFAVGSLAKSMVATVIVRLAEAGRLSLDDPVTVHVPELRGAGWAQRATVRDLLANRSGLPLRAQVEFSALEGSSDDVLSRFAARMATDAPTARFWSYSNAGWCLLGRVIETLTGLTWEEAMRTQLLVPLAMAQTTFVTSRSPSHGPQGIGPPPTAPSRSRRGRRGPTARRAARCCRPWATCCGSRAAISRTPPWPSCARLMPRSGSPRGWMPGAWDGRGSTGTAVRCGDGTASSAAAARCCGWCRGSVARWCCSPMAATDVPCTGRCSRS